MRVLLSARTHWIGDGPVNLRPSGATSVHVPSCAFGVGWSANGRYLSRSIRLLLCEYVFQHLPRLRCSEQIGADWPRLVLVPRIVLAAIEADAAVGAEVLRQRPPKEAANHVFGYLHVCSSALTN